MLCFTGVEYPPTTLLSYPITSEGRLKCVGQSEETNGLAHRRLDVERLDVLPVLLEQRDEEVDACARGSVGASGVEAGRLTQHDVSEDLVLGHLDVADGDAEAKNLLELELDGRANLSELAVEVLGVRDGRRELAGYNNR